jgi:hypothetical protein
MKNQKISNFEYIVISILIIAMILFGGRAAQAQDFKLIDTDVIIVDSVRMQDDTSILNKQIHTAQTAVEYYSELATEHGKTNPVFYQKLKFWEERLNQLTNHKKTLI